MGIMNDIGPFGAVGVALGLPSFASMGMGRSSIEIDGRRFPLSADGIEQARLAMCADRIGGVAERMDNADS